MSKQAIGVACREGGPLHEALVGTKLDPGHRDAREYLARKKRSGKHDAAPTEAQVSVPAPRIPTDDGSPEFIAALTELKLSEIEERFGTRPELEEWLKARKLAEEVREKRLKNDETDGTLIERELVRKHLFAFIEEAFQRLLTDTAKTVTRTLYANAKAGIPVEQSERQVRDIMTKTLEPMKRRAARVLRESH